MYNHHKEGLRFFDVILGRRNTMNENNKTPNSELGGFDSVQKEGYTLTPDGGFYSEEQKPSAPHVDETDKPSASAPQADAASGMPSRQEPHSEPPRQPSPQEPDFVLLDQEPVAEQNSNGQNYAEPGRTQPQESARVYYSRPPKQRKEKRSVSVATVVLCILLSVVIGAASGVGAVLLVDRYTDDTPSDTVSQGRITNTTINVEKTADSVIEAVAEKAGPSVVGIRTTMAVSNFFGGSEDYTGEGSGIIYTSDGYIITNYHVLESAIESSNAKIEVFMNDGSEKSYTAGVVGYNISNDLAVIKIEASSLEAIEIGDSDSLKQGQSVAAIGCPGGLNFIGSVSSGIISGLNRTMNSSNKNTVSLIQTDAAINPGNSGGALLDAKGRLIGVNSSKIASTDYEGMGFAIPVNTVVAICDNIIAHKDDPTPFIGITLSETYSEQTLRYLGFPTGAVVLSVVDGSPADEAGIRRGDIITEFAGVEIGDYSQFPAALNDCTVGDTVTVKLYRSGRYYTTDLTISSNSAQ